MVKHLPTYLPAKSTFSRVLCYVAHYSGAYSLLMDYRIHKCVVVHSTTSAFDERGEEQKQQEHKRPRTCQKQNNGYGSIKLLVEN